MLIQVYDYICSLHDEWTFLLQSRWTKVKSLYVTARYVPFFLIAVYICLAFTPDESPKTCKMLVNIFSCFVVISLTCSECFFVLRTYALWSNNRTVLVVMLSTLSAVIASFIGIWFSDVATSQYFTSSAIPGIPGITGGYRTSSSVQLYLPFVLLFVFQLGMRRRRPALHLTNARSLTFSPGLLSLTLIRAIQDWHSTRYPLYTALVKHNIFYYVCGLLFSASNVLVPVIFPDSAYHAFLENFEIFILAILATRMHLCLWHIDNTVHDFNTLMWISMPDMSPAA
ncbi:hypothetical protein BDR04DRAFT_1153263 [Suillus decipiens]|nr:hypothetical protein BDR04DRAFT_1153263 [Suillus decipiens]